VNILRVTLMAVFQPNLTSKVLFKAATKHLEAKHRDVLELGCGSGWITKQLLDKFGRQSHNWFLSDISEEAIVESNTNLVPPLATGDLRVGDGFSPWVGDKFDFIINDIAGIADEIAVASDWYNGVPFKAGVDGLLNTRNVLADLHSYLNPNGVFIAPVISLSNVAEYQDLLSKTFGEVIFENRTLWPLPESLSVQSALLQKLKKDENIILEEKYGKLLAFTEVCICRFVKNGQ
jgi:methylase of polypeptide subunit release factors